MPFDQFMRTWNILDICHLSCDGYVDQIEKLDEVRIFEFSNLKLCIYLKIFNFIPKVKNLSWKNLSDVNTT